MRAFSDSFRCANLGVWSIILFGICFTLFSAWVIEAAREDQIRELQREKEATKKRNAELWERLGLD